jgi:mitosis inhibitor protein kinase SWE1
MAARLPIKDDIEGEGDRRYIGPDLLKGHFDKPADIFALGMIMFEIAVNVTPPDNGDSWQKLRSAQWSGLPCLTSSSNEYQRDLGGSTPTDETHQSHESLYNPINLCVPSMSVENTEENPQAPLFMIDAQDEDSLDNLVHWMMSPDPNHRPTIDQVLITGGLNWVKQKRRSAATIFEGPWGPSTMILTPFEDGMDNDHEMTDA